MVAAPTVLATCFALTLTLQPDAGTDDGAMQRLSEHWHAAREYALPGGFAARYSELRYPELSDGEFRALAEQVEGKPDHPGWAQLEAERRRRIQPDRTDFQVWFVDSTTWRYSITYHWQDLYADFAANRDAIWSMVPQYLTIIDPRSGAPSNRDLAGFRQDFTREISRFIWAQLGLGSTIGVEPTAARIDADGKWWTVAAAPGWSTWRWSGEYSEEASRPLVHTVVLVESLRIPRESGMSWRYKNWQYEPVIGQWLAKTIEEYDSAGRLTKMWKFGDCRAVSDDEVRQLVQLPAFDGSDPVRGPVTFTSVFDHRAGQEQVVSRSPDGTMVRQKPSGILGRNRTPWLQNTGWIAASVIVAALVGLRLRRRVASNV